MKSVFHRLLEFLKEDKDKLEFMQVAQEVGLGAADVELAKLLVALQLYKAYYADIPTQIKEVNHHCIAEVRRVRDEVEHLANCSRASALEVSARADAIKAAIERIDPKAVAETLHKRLVDETLRGLSGATRLMAKATQDIEIASKSLSEAAREEVAIVRDWQAISLRGIWLTAFAGCSVVVTVLIMVVWLGYLRYQPWFIHLNHTGLSFR